MMLIATGRLTRTSLADRVAVVTGGGGGIGYEAARALIWLGARVIIAEVNPALGQQAADALAREWGDDTIRFIQTDVGEADSIEHLAQAAQAFGPVDIVLNNATRATVGAVLQVPIDDWDANYRVNLRGPVLLARAFLPGMLARNQGTFVCVSSTGTAYLGAYETFKAAQLHLANTLDAELEGTGVVAFTIGPGLVPTPTAQAAVARLAPSLGMSVDEFFAMNSATVLSVEEAGAGFAASIALADQFRGQEIASLQALKAAGISLASSAVPAEAQPQRLAHSESTLRLCRHVRATLAEQSAGWKQRSLFERQWVIRDFKKTAGMPVEEWLNRLGEVEEALTVGQTPAATPPLARLAGYYAHLAQLAKGYEKDPAKLKDSLQHVTAWQDEVEQLAQLLNPKLPAA